MVRATSQTVVAAAEPADLTIAVSGWLVWREVGFAVGALPLTIFALQLVLNAALLRSSPS